MMLLLSLLNLAHAIQLGLTVDQSSVNSRWDYDSTSTFSLMAKDARETRVQFGVGGRVFEMIGGTDLGSYRFTAPETRTLSAEQINTTAIFTGARAKSKFAWLGSTYRHADALYLIENTPTTFDLRKAPTGFAVATLTLFGFGQFYRLAIDVDLGVPVVSARTDLGALRFTQYNRALGRIEFGGYVRVGAHAGLANQVYRIEQSSFNRTDSILGLTLSIGGDKKSWLNKSAPATTDYVGLYPGT